MVNTVEIRSCFLLQPFIRCYTFRESTENDTTVIRPLFATYECAITFNLIEKKYGFIKAGDGKLIYPEEQLRSEIAVTGIGSQFAGFMTSDGAVRVFSIYFTPTGFYDLFGIPPSYYTDRIEEDEYACEKGLSFLYEALRESKTVGVMMHHAEAYFLGLLRQKKTNINSPILAMANKNILSAGNITVEQSAINANMSLKTFERRFIEQVGTSPKLFGKIVRFNKALALKMQDMKRTWTSIAHECGYFDQMHFIKDFKRFSGNTPNNFFRHSPPVAEHFVDAGE